MCVRERERTREKETEREREEKKIVPEYTIFPEYNFEKSALMVHVAIYFHFYE